MSIKAVYVSVWDDGIEIRSKCVVNGIHFEAETVNVDGMDLESCTREYIEFPDGTEIEVDPDDQVLVATYSPKKN